MNSNSSMIILLIAFGLLSPLPLGGSDAAASITSGPPLMSPFAGFPYLDRTQK